MPYRASVPPKAMVSLVAGRQPDLGKRFTNSRSGLKALGDRLGRDGGRRDVPWESAGSDRARTWPSQGASEVAAGGAEGPGRTVAGGEPATGGGTPRRPLARD